MLDPKAFYRALDAMLAQIRLQSDGSEFLPDILEAFEAGFGSVLHFGGGRLYEERDEVFVRTAGSGGPKEFAHDHPLVASVIEHGSYIFQHSDITSDLGTNGSRAAGFSVWRTNTRRWLFFYVLTEGWAHEEVAVAMNAVRFALNGRLQAEAVRNDLEQSAEIQRSLLPADLPRFPGFEFAAISKPAESVGGDFYDFITLGDDTLGVSIGDASGHGLPAALLVRDVMVGLRMGMEAHLKLLYTMKKLNRVVHRSAWSSRFMSVFYSEIERNGNVLYANAGHVSPMLFHKDGITELEPTGTVFGPLPEIPLERAYVSMKPGDVLLLLTDGIVERFSRDNQMFGTEGVTEVVTPIRDQSAQTILDAVLNASSAFGGAAPLADDATLVVVRRLPKPS